MKKLLILSILLTSASWAETPLKRYCWKSSSENVKKSCLVGHVNESGDLVINRYENHLKGGGISLEKNFMGSSDHHFTRLCKRIGFSRGYYQLNPEVTSTLFEKIGDSFYKSDTLLSCSDDYKTELRSKHSDEDYKQMESDLDGNYVTMFTKLTDVRCLK